MALHHLATVAGAAAVIAGIAVTSAAGVSTAKPTTVTTNGAIEALAIDGRVVAYDLEARPLGCNTVHAWNVATGKDVVVSGAGTCGADSTSTGAGVRELAVAGRRIAWIVELGGNTESGDTLYTAVVGLTRERLLARAFRSGDVDGELVGSWIGNLSGDGGLVAVNRWGTVPGGASVAPRLVRVRAGLTTLHAGPGSLAVRAVDTGRIAIETQAGVEIRDTTGRLVTSFRPRATVRAVALRKDYVVLLTDAPALEVRHSTTGALLDAIPVPPGGRDLDVHASIATFAIGRTVRAVRLATGRQATIATAPKAIVDVRIDDAGVAYAYNPVTGVKGVGRLVFLPLSLVQAKVA